MTKTELESLFTAFRGVKVLIVGDGHFSVILLHLYQPSLCLH